MYSSMYQNPETYDIVGMELYIVRRGREYYAFMQYAEGEPGEPVIVKIEVRGSSIEFRTPESYSPPGSFIGKIEAGGIRGRWAKADFSFFLERGRSFWQKQVP